MDLNIGDNVIIVNTQDIWEGKSGTIEDISKDEIIADDGTNLTDVTVRVKFDEEDPSKNILQVFSMNNLQKDGTPNINESINESIEADQVKEDNISPDEMISKDEEEDIIHDYVNLLDIDDNIIPSWYFVSAIAAVEKMEDLTVIELAKKLKYPIYTLEGDNFYKVIILDKKCKLDKVYEDYINYIPNKIKVTEVK